MSSFDDVRKLVQDNADISDVGTPSPVELIESAQSYLGVSFPPDYERFLREWGTLAVGPLEFYGITGADFENSTIPNTIWFTKRKREQLGLLSHLVILYDNNGVEYYCLDTSRPPNSPVVVWSTQTREVTAEKASTLWDFITTEVADFV